MKRKMHAGKAFSLSESNRVSGTSIEHYMPEALVACRAEGRAVAEALYTGIDKRDRIVM